MKIGIVGTGAIAAKHGQAWLNIGCSVVACANRNAGKGREFAARFGARFLPSAEDVCRDPNVELVDVCTFPDFRLQPVELCAALRKAIQVQKPIATNLRDARRIAALARHSGVPVGVVSQHRFDECFAFLKHAIEAERLGRLLECDAYVKWYRPPEYYARSFKGTWETEGGGALINQAIHQIDLLRWLAGPVRNVTAHWRLGAVHRIQSEDLVNALLQFKNGALGVIQASTALLPGYPERIELHGTAGSATVTGDQLTAWDVPGDSGAAPVRSTTSSGASDPMAISLAPFERQFLDMIDAANAGRQPAVNAEDGVNALAIVESIYQSCRTGLTVDLPASNTAA